MDGIKVIADNTEFPIALPWNGKLGVFVVRMLNATQIKACGDFSTLINVVKTPETAPSVDDMIDIKNMQEKLMKLCMVNPTYQQVIDKLYDSTLIANIKKEMELAKEEIKSIKDAVYSDKLAAEIKAYELYLGFLMPEDFMGALTAIILQRDNTDVHKITHEMLLEAAIMAEKFHKRPSEFVVGEFTEFQNLDIDKHALIELENYRNDQQIVNKKQWVRNKRKRK